MNGLQGFLSLPVRAGMKSLQLDEAVLEGIQIACIGQGCADVAQGGPCCTLSDVSSFVLEICQMTSRLLQRVVQRFVDFGSETFRQCCNLPLQVVECGR